MFKELFVEVIMFKDLLAEVKHDELLGEATPSKKEMIDYIKKFKDKKYKDYSWTDIRDSVAAEFNIKDLDYISDKIGSAIYYYCQRGKNCKGSR